MKPLNHLISYCLCRIGRHSRPSIRHSTNPCKKFCKYLDIRLGKYLNKYPCIPNTIPCKMQSNQLRTRSCPLSLPYQEKSPSQSGRHL